MDCFGVLVLFLILSLIEISFVSSHSWLHCSKYAAVITGQDYDESQCSGYIRQWSSHWGATSFSTDRGVNYFGSNDNWCQTGFISPIDDMYDNGYPYAEYYVGDTVRIVWPAKNHANYDCFNNIPDTSMKLFYSNVPDRTSDPTTLNDNGANGWQELVNFQDGCTPGTDGCGFQNCPKFCDNTDDAPCFGDFEIKAEDFPSGDGIYTFMWYWIFNGGTAAYTTCFEAKVSTSGGGGSSAQTPQPTSPSTPQTPQPTTSPVPPTPQPTRPPLANGVTYAPTPSPTNSPASGVSSLASGDYFIMVPICVKDAQYNADTVISGANNAFGATVSDWQIRAGTLIETGDVIGEYGFDVTIQTFTDYPDIITSTAYSYSDDSSLLCDTIEIEFGGGDTNCTVCEPGDIGIYATSNAYGSAGTTFDTSNANTYTITLTINIISIGIIAAIFFKL